MASGDAAIRAFKAMPGAASRTFAPQGALNAPNFGQMSPLVQQLSNEGQYSRTYGPGFLPREPRTFTEGAFGPFSPILPVSVDQPAEGTDFVDARLWQFRVGWNLPVGEPGQEGIKLADFATLKTLADLYSVARACVQLRKSEIAGLEWDIVPTKDAAKAYHGSPKSMRDFGERRGKVLKFFRKPDPDYFSYQTFMLALLEEVFVFDALSLLVRPKRGRGLGAGVLGSDLDCLELISGPTMRPLIGMHGEIPRPPSPAYQQYLYGVPRSDYMTMITERDIEEGGLHDAAVNAWSADQFLYLPLVPRRWTPYGFPPVERALIPIMSGLQKQAFQLDYFKEGTVPAVYVSPGDVNMTPNQIRELQDALNAFAGDPAWHHKVIVLPPGSKVDPQKPVDVADQFDDIVMTQVCQAFDVNPMELGILPKVAATQAPSAVKQLAQAAGSIHERISTKPTLKFLADIFDSILINILHQDDMKFTFEGLQEDAEQGMLTDLLIQQVQSGIRSVDEARDQLELQPWGLEMTSGPVVFTASGPLPFNMPVLPATPGQAQGGAQRQAPTSAAGPAPLQQAGRQGGQPAPTPGHAAASAANASSRTRTSPTISAPATGSVSGIKTLSPAAVKSELAALTRHLNKGRRITTWRAIHIPSHAMAMISEDLAKGLTPEQCADVAKTILLGQEDYRWLTGDEVPKAAARRDAPWNGISQTFTPRIEAAFRLAIGDIGSLIEDWWTGQVVLTRSSLIDAIQHIIQDALEPVLKNLWAEAWRVNDDTAGGYYVAWASSEGLDILQRIAKSRLPLIAAAIQQAISEGAGPKSVIMKLAALLDIINRARMMAVTETGRAATAAAERNFKSTGITFKVWQTANDSRVCAVCLKAQDEGAIPLDSLFNNGLMGPPAHPNCRCDLLPAGDVTKDVTSMDSAPRMDVASLDVVTDVDPGQDVGSLDSVGRLDLAKDASIHPGERDITCGRGHTHHGEFGAAGLLIRNRGDDGKVRYLLQKRSPEEDDPGTWSLPGGALLEGESAADGAFREFGEEMGEAPASVTVHHHVVDDHDGWAFTTLVCDSPDMFSPSMDGETADESSGFGWFTQREIEALPLHPGFKESWESVIRTRKNTALGKCMRRRVDLSGQVYLENPQPCPCHDPSRGSGRGDFAAGGGGPEFMPHDVNDIQHGRASNSRGGGTSGHFDDAGVVRNHDLYPEWDDDGDYPDRPRGRSEHQGGYLQGYQGHFWPQGGQGTGQPGGMQPVATAPRGDGSGRVSKCAGGPAGEKVQAQLAENFPSEALGWLMESTWVGPKRVQLKDIDFSDMKTWSAYKEPDRVHHFEKLIQDGEKFHPPVLIRVPGKKRLRVVDGHHRALAYRNLGEPLKEAWIGDIPARLQLAAEETHSSQLHQGSSSANK